MFIGKIFLLIFVAHTKKIFSSNLPFLKFRVRSYQHKIQVIICFTNQKEKGFMKFSVDLNTNRLAVVLLVYKITGKMPLNVSANLYMHIGSVAREK